MKVFARINHAKGAESLDKQLRPTELLIFGNPKVGTPLMQCDQRSAINLPQKVLIWQDAKDNVWLSYNDTNYLSNRHGLGQCGKGLNRVLEKVAKALSNFANAAAAP